MSGFEAPNWGGIFVPDLSLVESFLRGSVVYLSLVVLFRVVLKRQAGSIGLPDVMLVVLVSECVSASLAAEAKSVPNGLVAVFALLFWNYTLDRLSHREAWLQRLLEPQPLELVRDGRPLRENMEAEGITDEELAAQLRLNGIDDVARVKAAFIEAEGTISVVPKDGAEHVAPPGSLSPKPVSHSPSDTPDFDRVTRAFLEAAAELQKAVAWHEEREAEHRGAAKSARQLLTRHGVRARRAVVPSTPPDPRSPRREDPEGAEVVPARPEPTEARS